MIPPAVVRTLLKSIGHEKAIGIISGFILDMVKEGEKVEKLPGESHHVSVLYESEGSVIFATAMISQDKEGAQQITRYENPVDLEGLFKRIIEKI